MADHRTVSLGLMGKLFDKVGAGQINIGAIDEIVVDIEAPEINVVIESPDIVVDVECD